MLTALLLVFVALGILQFFMPKPKTPPPDKNQTQQEQQSPQAPPATPSHAQTLPNAPSTSGKNAPRAQVAKVPVKVAAREAESVLENNVYRITFSNHGAVVKSWILKKFKDNAGKPFDNVNQTIAPQLGYPLSFFSYDKDLEKKLNEALYVVEPAAAGTTANGLTYEYSDGELNVRKTFRPDPENDNLLRVETEVLRNGQRVQAFPQWPSGIGDQLAPVTFNTGKVDWNQNGSVERKAPTSGGIVRSKKWIVGGETLPGPYDWVATADQYFAVAFLPDSPDNTTLVTLNSPATVLKNPDKPNEGNEKTNVVGIAFGNMQSATRMRIFAGAKAVNMLESIQSRPGGPDLRGIYDFGTFSFIARPLFLWLKWTYEHWIHNWGWAIAFLTLVITMALLPLRISSMKSSLRMQKIQPQMKVVQEKYKRYSITDPRRSEMQKEMQELYKKEGVNPVGGCFPLMLQMPFLYAFYAMLGNAIELRQAGWLWIHDLSAPDPLRILPILITVAMFVQQKSSPQGGMDPAQQKMLAFMSPLMFGAFSWAMPAGLSIYLAISTLLGYIQQIFINRSELGQQVRKTIEKRNARKR
jgi:YidC/Oxa1 family membrane protein insertase